MKDGSREWAQENCHGRGGRALGERQFTVSSALRAGVPEKLTWAPGVGVN